MVKLSRKENNINTKKRDIIGLLSAPGRYIGSKAKSIYRKLVKKSTKKSLLKYRIVYKMKKIKMKSCKESQ